MTQRVIKFRAWDKYAKIMRDDGSHPNGMPHMKYDVGLMSSDAKNEWATGIDGLEIRVDSQSFILMQFTGLLDKHGKEIYDGDIGIIKTQNGREEKFIVYWGVHRRDMASGWTVDIPGFAFFVDGKPTFPIVNNYLNGHDLDIIEIIGNIYSNPELVDPKMIER